MQFAVFFSAFYFQVLIKCIVYFQELPIKISGFINIEERKWIRMVRKEQREYVEYLWGDDKDADYYGLDDDNFSLKQLFGMEPYLQDIEEKWE